MEFTVTVEDLSLLSTLAICIGAIVGWIALLWRWDRRLPAWNGTEAIARVTPLRTILGLLPLPAIYLTPILQYMRSPQYPDFWAYVGANSSVFIAMIAAMGLAIIVLMVIRNMDQAKQALHIHPVEIVWDADGLSWTASRGITGARPWSAVRQIDRTRHINTVGKITLDDGRILLLSRGLVGAQQLLDTAGAATGISNGQSDLEEQVMPALRPA
ncbi:MAG: hypothetical protein AAGH74_15450 [Pseudomonadota bacterium]